MARLTYSIATLDSALRRVTNIPPDSGLRRTDLLKMAVETLFAEEGEADPVDVARIRGALVDLRTHGQFIWSPDQQVQDDEVEFKEAANAVPVL